MQSSRIQEENVSNGGRNAINKTKQTALSLTCLCHHSGSDLTFMDKPNQFNQFSNHFVFVLNFIYYFVVMCRSAYSGLGDFKTVIQLSQDEEKIQSSVTML